MAALRALTPRERWGLSVQRALGRLCAPFTTLAVHWLLARRLGLRLADTTEIRRVYRELDRDRSTPMLLCANHLTLIDSSLIAWALGSPAWYMWRFRALPWNLPEVTNFATVWWQRAFIYVYKCLPIARGGDREDVASTLARFAHVVRAGDAGLVFPEAGRTRSGRVEVDQAAYGVGRIVRSLPGCRVLCVYLRGDRQERYSDLPIEGDTLRTRLRVIEPKSDHKGLRASLDIARQITQVLVELEEEHFAACAGTAE